MVTLLIDGQTVDAYPNDLTHFHGHSVFTTLRSQSRELLLWDRHWQRLTSHAHFFDYHVPPEQQILALLHDQLQKTTLDVKIRIILYAQRFALTCEPYVKPSSSIYQGVSIVMSSIRVHPQLCQFKTGNSLPYVLAYKEALQQGAFEALLCDGHDIVDGSRTSIVMFDGKIMTALDGGLYGCMREAVLDYAKTLGIPVEKKRINKDQLQGQLLLCNSLIGVVPVKSIKFALTNELIAQFRMD